MKIIRMFTLSWGILLTVTAVAKLLSTQEVARIFLVHAPIFGIQFRYLLRIAAVLELGVAFCCFIGKSVASVRLVAWLTTVLMIYRIGLKLVGYKTPCACLGNLTDALRISPQSADLLSMLVLAYLFAGSVSMLVYLRVSARK
jgi:hypothetical protein